MVLLDEWRAATVNVFSILECTNYSTGMQILRGKEGESEYELGDGE